MKFERFVLFMLENQKLAMRYTSFELFLKYRIHLLILHVDYTFSFLTIEEDLLFKRYQENKIHIIYTRNNIAIYYYLAWLDTINTFIRKRKKISFKTKSERCMYKDKY